MADEIVQRIVLDGNDDVTRALGEIAEAGERAGRRLEEAFAAGIFSAEGIGLVIGGAVASVGLLTAAAAEFTRRMEEVVDSTKELAQGLGISTEEMSGLSAAFAAGGVGTGEMEQSFRRLATVVQNSWDQIKRESANSVDKLKGDALSVAEAEERLGDAQQNSARLARDQADARIKSTNNVASAELRLRDAQLALARSRGVDTSVQDAALGRARQRLAVEEAQQALRDAQLKKQREAEEQESQARKAALAEEKAGLELDRARRQQREDQANDIKNVTEAVKKTAEGDGEALKSVNASAENVVKGIIAATEDGQKALSALRGDISDLSAPAPQATQVLETLGKTLANIEDPMLKTAVAARFFGRTVSQSFIEVLSDQDKLKEFQDRIKDLGLGINEADVAISDKFRAALFTLQNDLQLVSVKVASAFGPTFTSMLEGADSSLLQMKDIVIEVAKAFDAGPIRGFLDILSSIGDLGGAGLKLVGEALQFIADMINKITGSDFTALSLALQPVVSALNIVKYLVDAITNALKLMASALSGEGFSDRLGALTDKLGNQLSAIGEFLSGDFKKGIADFNKASDDYDKRLKNIDSVEKQVSEGQRRRQRELADDTEKSNEDAVKKQKESLDKVDEDHKKSVDNRLADQKRLESQTDQSSQKTQQALANQRKAAQSDGGATPDLSGPGGVIGGGGQFLRQLFDKFGGPFTINGVSVGSGLEGETIGLGRGVPIGTGSGASVSSGRPELDQGILDAQRREDVTKRVMSEAVKQGIQGAVREAPPQAPRPFSVGPDSNSPTGIPTGEPFPRLPLPEQVPLSKDLQNNGWSQWMDEKSAVLKSAFDSLSSSIGGFVDKIKGSAAEQASNTKDALEQLLQTITEKANSLAPQQDNTITDPVDALGVRGALDDATSQIASVGNTADSASSGLSSLESAAQAAATALSSIPANAGSGGDVVEVAEGGHITGPGTSTSDSIAAWLSHDEFVQPARATRHYGISFMESIRNLSFPKIGFADGGLVSMFAVPRFRDGGVVTAEAANGGGGFPALGSIDLRMDAGRFTVMATRSTASDLQRASVNQRISSTTKRTPGFVS